jgi:hypothetical protein
MQALPAQAWRSFDNLFYADTAMRSYRDFAQLKQQGMIPAHCRFQVDLVPAHSVIWLFLQDDLHRALDPIYNEALRREIDRLAQATPHDQLAIQFDVVPAVFARRSATSPMPTGATRRKCSKHSRRSWLDSPITCGGTSSCCFTSATATPITVTSSSRSRSRQSSLAHDQARHPVDP